MTMLILCAGIAGFAALLVHLASTVVVLVRSRESGIADDFTPELTLIRPVCGLENHIVETLGSSFRLDHPSYQIIFCVSHAGDPVVPLIRGLIAQHPAAQAHLLIGSERISDNPKLNNLAKGWRAACHDWVLLADSNVLMPADCIAQLFAAWRADTGLVCSPPVGCRPQGFWAELECAFLNTYQARWQLFADQIGLGFAQGKTMLLHRKILERARGLRALAVEPAEDAAATKLVRKAGFRVSLVSNPFPQPLGRRSADEVWQRQLRWARLRRATFKHFHALEILTGSLPALLAGAAVACAVEWPVGACTLLIAAIWYGAEALLAYVAGWHLSCRSPCAWLLRDLLIPVLWAASWLGNDFVWRGNAMQVADRDPSS